MNDDIDTQINTIISKLIGLNGPLRRRFRSRIKRNFDRLCAAFKKELKLLNDSDKNQIYDNIFFSLKSAYHPNLFSELIVRLIVMPISELHKKVIKAKIILVNTDIILHELKSGNDDDEIGLDSKKKEATSAIIRYNDGTIVPEGSLDYLILQNSINTHPVWY